MPRKKDDERLKDFIVENVSGRDIPYRMRNFSGEERKDPHTNQIVNAKGDRNFCLFLSTDLALQLKADGWNVRELKPIDKEDSGQPFLPIKLGYSEKSRPPKIIIVNSAGQQHQMDVEEVHKIDGMDIDYANIKIHPYLWNVQNKSGVKAYLRSIYIHIAEDELDRKYSNVPVSAAFSEEEELPFN